jgi:hypothetical protein
MNLIQFPHLDPEPASTAYQHQSISSLLYTHYTPYTMLSLYRTSALVAPLKAGVRPIASSAILMAKKKEVGELFIHLGDCIS